MSPNASWSQVKEAVLQQDKPFFKVYSTVTGIQTQGRRGLLLQHHDGGKVLVQLLGEGTAGAEGRVYDAWLLRAAGTAPLQIAAKHFTGDLQRVQSCVDKTLGPLCQIKALQLELSGASPAGAVVVGRSASERETDLGDSHFFVAAEGLALGEGPDSVWLLMAHQSVVLQDRLRHNGTGFAAASGADLHAWAVQLLRAGRLELRYRIDWGDIKKTNVMISPREGFPQGRVCLIDPSSYEHDVHGRLPEIGGYIPAYESFAHKGTDPDLLKELAVALDVCHIAGLIHEMYEGRSGGVSHPMPTHLGNLLSTLTTAPPPANALLASRARSSSGTPNTAAHNKALQEHASKQQAAMLQILRDHRLALAAELDTYLAAHAG